jgi:hypothetical protein
MIVLHTVKVEDTTIQETVVCIQILIYIRTENMSQK